MENSYMRFENRTVVKLIKNRKELYGLHWILDYDDEFLFHFEDYYGFNFDHDPYRSPNRGTTYTELPSSNGVYSKPVYYDWSANWERVSKIIPTPEVQDALKLSLQRTTTGPTPWNPHTVWPFVFSLQSDIFMDEIKAALTRKYLPPIVVRELNTRIANWHSAMGKRLIKEEEVSLCDVIEEMGERFLYQEASGRKLVQVVTVLSDRALFKVDGPLREMLLCGTVNHNAFGPFNLKLAEILSPPGTTLHIYRSAEYSVVIDETRNIVFDNCNYFYQVPASKALDAAKSNGSLFNIVINTIE